MYNLSEQEIKETYDGCQVEPVDCRCRVSGSSARKGPRVAGGGRSGGTCPPSAADHHLAAASLSALPAPIPRPEPPPASYKIDALEVDARVTDQVAKVQVSQSFVNTGSRLMEVAFIFPLPYDGAIDRMTLLVDGKEMPAKLLSADDARRAYEEIVRKNRDPALLEWVGTGMFKTSVFPVPPGAKRTVSLRYVQLCRKQEGMTDFLFPLSTAKYTSQPVEKINFRVSVESQEDIKNVYSPTHAVEIKRPDDRHAVVSYTAKDQVPASDFRLLYDIGRGKVSTRVLTYRPDQNQDGYFLLLTSPEIKASSERPKKTVLLVMDRSGSMSGQKIEQVRAALKHVLNNLREGDLFNVIAFDSEVESFRPELQRYNDKTRREALGFAEGLYAGGSTNINEALRVSLAQLTDAGRPSYVVFLTDGLPTVGETNEMRIVANSKEFNKVHARVFCFGVGYDLNARFLDKLVRENFGQSEYVRPDENIEEHVARLYNRIESPVLTGMKMRYDFDTVKTEEGSPISRVYPHEAGDLFAGDQLVVVGRYKKAGTAKVVVTGKIGDKEERFDFPATFVEKSNDESLAFIEKLWAVRRVGEILDQMDLNGKNNELVKELVELATRHGILTPYTSFMADETTNIHDLTSNFDRANRRLESLSQTGGAAGTAQRAMKGDFQNAYNYSVANDYAGRARAAEKKDCIQRLWPLRPGSAGEDGGWGTGRPCRGRRGIWRSAWPSRGGCRLGSAGKCSGHGSGQGGRRTVLRRRDPGGGRQGPAVGPQYRQSHLLSPPEPVDRFPGDAHAAAERPQGQAVQQGVFRPGQSLRPFHVAVPGHG